MAEQYYYLNQDNKTWAGPISMDQLRFVAKNGSIHPDTMIACDGKQFRADSISGLFVSRPTVSSFPIPMAPTNLTRPPQRPIPQSLVTPISAPIPVQHTPAEVRPPMSATSKSPSAPVFDAGQGAFPGGESAGELQIDENMPYGDSEVFFPNKINIGEAILQIPVLAVRNVVPIVVNTLTFLLVSWIPLINMRAFVGSIAISAKIGERSTLPLMEVLDNRYENHVSNYFIYLSTKFSTVWPALMFSLRLPLLVSVFALPLLIVWWLPILLVPLILIGMTLSPILTCSKFAGGWYLAPILVCADGINATEAMSLSVKCMANNQMTSFFLSLLFFLVGLFLGCIVAIVSIVAHSFAVAGILGTPLLVLFFSLRIAKLAYFYDKLVPKNK